ncbi:MAG: hypothetical protein M0Z66_11170 [Thermaerobacter sp.]|nr:hypothetical protein [Thermaerobacter sp.]
MNRVLVQAMGAAAVLIGAALLVWRWQSVGFPPLMVLLGLLLLVGVPSALWLSLGSRPAAVPRRLPRVFWIGIALLALGFLDILLGVAGLSPGAAAPISIPMGSGRPQDSLRFAPLPKDATTEFRAVFPDLVVGRSLASTDGPMRSGCVGQGAVPSNCRRFG